MPPLASVSFGAVVFGAVLLLAAVWFAVGAARETGTQRVQSGAIAVVAVGLGVDQLTGAHGALALAAFGLIAWVGAAMRARDRARRGG